jgi:predicted phage terminase large subunit-like protein
LAWLNRATARLKIVESREDCEAGLIDFVRGGWKYIDPNPYVHGWHLEAISEHLEAVVSGEIRRLIINIPPRTSKSSVVSVAFPAWVWAQKNKGPLSGPQVQFLHASYASSLSIRDSVKTRRLISSPWYQERWGSRFSLTGDQNSKIRFDNSAGGYRLATSVGGALTGEGGSIIVVDDPNNAVEMESDAVRQATLDWWDNSLSTRLNDPKTGAYVVIMQRLHQNDLTGHILERAGSDWCHLMLPMRYDSERAGVTGIGWEDPRTEDGQLLCPERFGEEEVSALERALGPYQSAGQLQQSPSPKGGGIIKREWWQTWDEVAAKEQGVKSNSFPPMDVVIASLDTAYTEKQENDPSALTIWGVWQRNSRLAKSYLNERGERIVFDESVESIPQVMLMTAWEKRLAIHGPEVARFPDETDAEFQLRTQSEWGLCEWVAHSCNKFKVDILLIEAKASGISVAQELKRLHKYANWQVRLVNPGAQDKVARAYSVQASFSNGVVWAPDRDWADKVITQAEVFPKAKHDDLVDSTVQALRYIRDNGLLQRADEIAAQVTIDAQHRPKAGALYDV